MVALARGPTILLPAMSLWMLNNRASESNAIEAACPVPHLNPLCHGSSTGTRGNMCSGGQLLRAVRDGHERRGRPRHGQPNAVADRSQLRAQREQLSQQGSLRLPKLRVLLLQPGYTAFQHEAIAQGHAWFCKAAAALR